MTHGALPFVCDSDNNGSHATVAHESCLKFRVKYGLGVTGGIDEFESKGRIKKLPFVRIQIYSWLVDSATRKLSRRSNPFRVP